MNRAIAIAAVFAIALIVRIPTAWNGLPYLYAFDEPQIVSSAVYELREHTLDPDFSSYGHLPIHLTAGALAASGAVVALPDPATVTLGRDTGWPWELGAPEYYTVARLFSAVLGALTAAFTTAAAMSFTRSSAVAALAGPTLALSPGFATATSYVSVDGFTAFFGAILLLIIARSPTWPWWAVVGAAGATAAGVASKYHPILFAAVIPLVMADTVPDRSRKLAAYYGATALLILAMMPAALFDPADVVSGIAGQIRHYAAQSPAAGAPLPGPQALIFQLSSVADELSIVMLVLFGVAAWARPTPLLVPVALYLCLFSVTRTHFHRNLFAVYPWIAVAAVIGWEAIRASGRLRRPHPREVPFAALLIGIIAAHLVGTFAPTGLRAWRFWEDPRDSRSRIIERAVREGTPIAAVAAELRLHPRDLQLLGAIAAPVTELARLEGNCVVPGVTAPGDVVARDGEVDWVSDAWPMKNSAVAIVRCRDVRPELLRVAAPP